MALCCKHLRDTNIEVNGETVNLLEEVDMISSVSGGNTAAYYDLYGDQIFENYEETFLYHEVSKDLFLKPAHLQPVVVLMHATRQTKYRRPKPIFR